MSMNTVKNRFENNINLTIKFKNIKSYCGGKYVRRIYE